ncbi:MAG: hypothetical protein WCI27_07310 [Candidatus Omnitrophota bacterium]
MEEKKGKSSSGIAARIFVGLKFLLAVVLLPLVIATVVALQGEVRHLAPVFQQAILQGVLAYVFMKFFVYDFDAVYKYGQTIVGACFQFLKPLMNFAPYVIPIYTIFLVIAYAIVHVTGKIGANNEMAPAFFAVIAFTFAMHIILTAQDLYSKDSTAGKPDYFFGMALIFIIDVFFMALLLNLAVSGFSFVEFFKTLSVVSAKIYMMIFNQLFVR